MRRYQYIVLYLLTVLLCMFLAGCGQKAEPLVLPAPEDISAITVTNDNEVVHHIEPAWIAEFVTAVSAGEPTNKESVQDTPLTEPYSKIEFVLADGNSVIFFYEQDGAYYIEQPYVGIYEVDSRVQTLLQ